MYFFLEYQIFTQREVLASTLKLDASYYVTVNRTVTVDETLV